MLGPLRTLAFVPSANLADTADLPAPAAHIILSPPHGRYRRRRIEVQRLLAQSVRGDRRAARQRGRRHASALNSSAIITQIRRGKL
jgi:hypothetical protein